MGFAGRFATHQNSKQRLQPRRWFFGVPHRVPGECFQSERSQQPSVAEQLQLARSNAAAFTLDTLDVGRFRSSPFVAKPLLTAKFVYVRDDRLGKTSLAPKYSGPFRVIEKNWENNTFRVDLGRKEDSVALARLKAASIQEEATWGRCWGEGCCIDKSLPCNSSGSTDLRGYNLSSSLFFGRYFTSDSDSYSQSREIYRVEVRPQHIHPASP